MEKIIITYGTYDMLHIGHINILKRAKALGTKLIVGVTSEDYDRSRGKLNVIESVKKRVKKIKELDFVDKVVVEDHKGQKEEDIKKYNVDKFVIGDDWIGSFDYLKKYCEVVYLPRTKGISSTMIRKELDNTVKIGIVGVGRIANRFMKEVSYLDDVNVRSVVSRDINKVKIFNDNHEIEFGFDDYDKFLTSDIHAVYIASPHEHHYTQIKKSLNAGKHVLCEKPITLKKGQLKELLKLASSKKLILLEAVKTAFFPAFNKLLDELDTGIIGEVKEVRATFTKLTGDNDLREMNPPYGGSLYELGSYPLLLATKILGNSKKTYYFDQKSNGIDISNRVVCKHKNDAISISTVGLGIKSEGCAVISGTKGYIYVPAPWWLSKDFYIRYEDPNQEHSYHYDLEGDGLRYEISEFVTMIRRNKKESKRLSHKDMININDIIVNYKG